VRKQARILKTLLFDLGPLVTLMFIADRLLELVSRARIIEVQLRELSELVDLEVRLPDGYTAAVRNADTMGNLSPACAEGLTTEFLEAARRNADQCVVILVGDVVVSYQWLSNGLTPAYDDLWIDFGPRYLYGYNSFTAPDHRGKQLNRSGVVTAALSIAVPAGRGLAGYIMAGNVFSLLAHSRVARGRTGFALVWPHGARGLRLFASATCRRGGLRMERRCTRMSATASAGTSA
jgi:hypothetical protein